MKLTDGQVEVMEASGHQLVTGGPGSGKTTISILKAAQITQNDLAPGGKVMFLSFARATVSRIIETIEAEQQIPREQKRRIDVETYHSFFWRVIRSHGYLVGLPRRLSILTPANEAIALSSLRNDYPPSSKLSDDERAEKAGRENAERLRASREKGLVCFDLFAPIVGEIVEASSRVRRLLATMYPAIILDEFQDTNSAQWGVVKALGRHIRLIALADPEQRIFDFIGADPERLSHFRNHFSPTEVTLSTDNHRSPGTEIVAFGNDVLAAKFQRTHYSGIDLVSYDAISSRAWTALITTTYAARKRLFDSGVNNWSLAILVPTRKMTRLVSDAFQSPPAGMKPIPHTASVDIEAAILAAEVVALLMQADKDGSLFSELISVLVNYFRGRGGDTPTKKDLNEAMKLVSAFSDFSTRERSGKSIKSSSVLVKTLAVYEEALKRPHAGNPDEDWLAIRRTLDTGPCPRLRDVGKDVRFVRLLERGTQLRQELSQDWRVHGTYSNALAIVRQAFVQDHVAGNSRPERGVVVLNMHKAKGKQFDEVIIFDGWPRTKGGRIVANPDRIVRRNSIENCDEQARQNMRVSITRGKRRTTILTPKVDPCLLLRK